IKTSASMLTYHCLKNIKLYIKGLRPATCSWVRAGNRLILFSLLLIVVLFFFFTKVFNDPIHGHIELHPVLVKIINTPEFQRLRNIKQLGGVYFVYPGASHNRFEHSIGYVHGFLEKLKERLDELNESLISEQDVLCVQIAGLCHDLAPVCKMMKEYGLKIEEKSYPDRVFIEELIKGQSNASSLALSPQWEYKGRKKEKSFLYEIVANKETGIDVDKFDYFARDCHHLGIRNNFDHQRFIMFARVCDVEEEDGSKKKTKIKHICSRDKEVANLYDIFQQRHSIHRRACKHKIALAVEIMIKDALVLANEVQEMHIETSNATFSLSEAKDNMEAYMKLTDHVIEKILNSTSDKLEEARKILKRVMDRDLYYCVGQATVSNYTHVLTSILQEKKKSLKELFKDVPGVDKNEFVIIPVTFDYGMNTEDPISKAFFYRKDNPDKGIPISKSKVSKLLPERFSDETLRVYWKNRKVILAKENDIKKAFKDWCKDYGFEVLLTLFYLIQTFYFWLLFPQYSQLQLFSFQPPIDQQQLPQTFIQGRHDELIELRCITL
uniref:HD/PDEase domain-containing protein n=1 Tax=Maylandia zebra TaxID=106582 RepID=A0A3P9AWS2_9CICH